METKSNRKEGRIRSRHMKQVNPKRLVCCPEDKEYISNYSHYRAGLQNYTKMMWIKSFETL